jgi:hypothetical protein
MQSTPAVADPTPSSSRSSRENSVDQTSDGDLDNEERTQSKKRKRGETEAPTEDDATSFQPAKALQEALDLPFDGEIASGCPKSRYR